MSEPSTEIEAHRPQQLATVHQEPSIGNMLQAAIERGVTSENVAVLEKMMALYERQQAKNAEKEFAYAFTALQAEMPEIRAVKPVPDRNGNIKYHFAPYEEIMDKVKPLLLKHGFTISFSMTFIEGRVTQECTLQHIGGHSRKNQFSVRVGSGPPGASEAQADGAAGTYAKRHALCNALNITIDSDTDGFDAKKEGAPITKDQVVYLRELVKETKSDEGLFLKFAGAPTFEEIGSARYDDLARSLHKKQLMAQGK